MFAPRLAAAVLVLSSCAAWERSTPSYVAPPSESPTPSHDAPAPEPPAPAPVVVAEPVVEPPALPETPPEAPPSATPVTDRHAAISSVQLLEDCPEAASASGAAAGVSRDSAVSSSQMKRRPGPVECEQSTVQLAVRSNLAGSFRIDAVRVLDATTRRKVGTTTLRTPTQWTATSGTYDPWDASLVAGADLDISYKLGDLDVPPGKRGGPGFDALMGPFMLELDVTVAGKRAKIRSPEFRREPVRAGNIQT